MGWQRRTMELRRIIRTDIAASAIAHLSLVALILVISEVRPFHPPAIETVSVDIVTPDELQAQAKEEVKDKTPEPPADLKLPKLDFKDKAETATPPAPSPAPQASAPPEPAKPPAQASPNAQPQRQPLQPQASPPPARRDANAQPQLQAQSQPQSPPQPAPPPPSYTSPEPDVTVKYGVMLGLPAPLSPEPKQAAKDDGGDAKDSTAAKLPPEVVAEFRRHLRTCAKLPAGVSPSDDLRIRLRAVMATDGTLARAPILLEAPPSAKGPLLVRSAMAALQACQPYTMLPADKYDEWKVMDLPFTPSDFGGA